MSCGCDVRYVFNAQLRRVKDSRYFFSAPAGLRADEVGWPTGLEPATTRTTIWSSTIELQPPFRVREANKIPASAKGNFLSAIRMFKAIVSIRVPGFFAVWFLLTCVVGAAPTIVIDAGHGGYDRGGMPGQKIAEKGYALDVAQRLNSLLRSSGFRTVLTRKGDYFVTLGDRCTIANRISRAVFVSVHFNGASNRDASGIETYYYKGRESAALAAAIHQKVLSATGAENRWLRSRGFYVLRHTRCPSVLCELGFLTNAAESRRIASSSYRQRLAEAIASAIKSRYR